MTSSLSSQQSTTQAYQRAWAAFVRPRPHDIGRLFAILTIATIGTGCRREILSDLTEREAAKITNELRLRGIDATANDSGKQRYTISVVNGDAGEASHIAGLIKPLVATRGESAKPPGILSGPDEERLYVARQLSHQLEESLQLLPSVVAARVTIAFPPKPTIDEQRAKVADPGSASVLIIASSSSNLSTESLSHFIANGTTIPKDRIHVIISELPGSSEAVKQASHHLVEQLSTPNASLPLSEAAESNANNRPAVLQNDEGGPPAAIPFPSLPYSTATISLLIGIVMSIPIFFWLRARSLRMAFRHLA